MGTWGDGNFSNDAALDFLADVLKTATAEIKGFCASAGTGIEDLDVVMAGVAIHLALLAPCNASPPDVALATIYRYFTSKEHLYAAALVNWAADFPRGRAPAGGSTATDEDQLRALMRRAVRAFEHYPQMMRVEVVLESSPDPNARAVFDEFAGNNRRALMGAMSSVDAEAAAAIVETVNSVFVTRLRSWALGRATIRDVDRSVQRTLDRLTALGHDEEDGDVRARRTDQPAQVACVGEVLAAVDEQQVGVGRLEEGGTLGGQDLDLVPEQGEARQDLGGGPVGAGEKQEGAHGGSPHVVRSTETQH